VTATTTTSTAPRRGRPLLGAFAGLFLGLFVALDLILFGVLPLESGLIWVFAVAGIVLGVALGVWAPFGRGSNDTETAPVPPGPPDDYDSASMTSDGA
jgi:hypothetical protein